MWARIRIPLVYARIFISSRAAACTPALLLFSGTRDLQDSTQRVWKRHVVPRGAGRTNTGTISASIEAKYFPGDNLLFYNTIRLSNLCDGADYVCNSVRDCVESRPSFMSLI